MQSVPQTLATPFHLTRDEVWTGFKQLVPLSFFIIIFGAAFSLTASQKGLDSSSILLMSAAVFAGASQFGALDLWGAQVPLIPLILTVTAINARHLLMGASLYPWMKSLPVKQRYSMLAVMNDVNWASSMRAFSQGQSGLGLVLGGGIAMWLFWVAGNGLGLVFGQLIDQPQEFGLDMVMGCFLMAMAFSAKVNTRLALIWTGAAAASWVAYTYLPNNSHVIVGAAVGGFLGLLRIKKS